MRVWREKQERKKREKKKSKERSKREKKENGAASSIGLAKPLGCHATFLTHFLIFTLLASLLLSSLNYTKLRDDLVNSYIVLGLY